MFYMDILCIRRFYNVKGSQPYTYIHMYMHYISHILYIGIDANIDSRSEFISTYVLIYSNQ